MFSWLFQLGLRCFELKVAFFPLHIFFESGILFQKSLTNSAQYTKYDPWRRHREKNEEPTILSIHIGTYSIVGYSLPLALLA